MARYPKITADLRAQLALISAAGDFGLEYPPCDVRLKDGRRVFRVYVVPEDRYIKVWGVWPEDDKNKRSVRIDDVAESARARTGYRQYWRQSSMQPANQVWDTAFSRFYSTTSLVCHSCPEMRWISSSTRPAKGQLALWM